MRTGTPIGKNYVTLCIERIFAEEPRQVDHEYAILRINNTMSDIDILIQEKDRLKTDEILKSLGYERQGLGSNVWTYKRGLVTFEIHVNLAGKKILE